MNQDFACPAGCEWAVRSLGLLATSRGFYPLLYLLREMLAGRELDAALKREAAEHFNITTKKLWGRLRSMASRVRRVSPERFEEWFGSAGAKVSPDQFVRAVARYAAAQSR